MLRFAAMIRLGLGVLLLIAASLKLYGLGISAMPAVGWFAQPWLQLAVAEWEVILGLWLISGASRKASWLAALVTFLTFAGVSGYLGTVGATSCGCLGALRTNPWWVFGVDVLAVALLAIAYPRAEQFSYGANHFGIKWVGGVVALMLGATLAASAVSDSPEAALAQLRGQSLLAPDLDLGSGKPGDVLEGTAAIRNLTDHPIRVLGGNSDCSCTVLHDLPLTIEPGEAGTIGITMNVLPAPSGGSTRMVVLRTDAPRQSVVRFRVGCRIE